jgi:hypothetical protein
MAASTKKQVAEPVTTPAAQLTHKAVGTYKDLVSGEWNVVEIAFDPYTKATGELTVVTSTNSPDKGMAQESFKIAAAYVVDAFL